jgi:hypothetical protein
MLGVVGRMVDGVDERRDRRGNEILDGMMHGWWMGTRRWVDREDDREDRTMDGMVERMGDGGRRMGQ